jgi:hypothetical protein
MKQWKECEADVSANRKDSSIGQPYKCHYADRNGLSVSYFSQNTRQLSPLQDARWRELAQDRVQWASFGNRSVKQLASGTRDLIRNVMYLSGRSQWPRGLRHEPVSPARTLGSWVRIPLEAWMSVCVYSMFVLSCVGSDFATGWSPVQGVLLTV